DEKTYLHRVGRTGRAGNKGTAVTFVDWDDVPRWGLINKALGLDVPEPLETYSSSPHLFTDLDIPEGTKGRLPRSQRKLAGIDAEKLEDLGETGKRGGRAQGSGRGQDRAGKRGEQSEGRGRSRRRGSAPEAAAEPAAEPAAPAASAEQPADGAARRRTRSRTRRRNGEVVTSRQGAAE
ncbi:DEAD/DEAH box helicase, partial [Arthrobacter deserti]|nr:DEAD/DEAH box helicase [Arthrobacter deserti]